jgi:hypothetical protein
VTEPGGANTLQVTPFSEMAVAKAEGAGGLTEANIEGANADVRTYLGYDVLTAKPDFNADGTKPENKAALMLAAVSKLAADDTQMTSLGCSTSATTGERIKCLVEKMSEQGTSDGDLATKLDDAKNDVDDYEPDEENNDPADLVIPPPPEVQEPELVAPEDRTTSIAAAKALIANLRSNAPLLGGSANTDTLDKRMRAVRDVIADAANPVGDSSRELYKAIVDATHKLDRGDFQSGSFEIEVDNAMWGYCQYMDANNAQAAAPEDVTQIGCRITYKVFNKASANNTMWAYQHAFRVAYPEADGEPYTVKSATIEQKLNGDYSSNTSVEANTVYLSGGSAAPNLGAMALSHDDNGEIIGLEMSGQYAAGVKAAINGYAAYNTVQATFVPEVSPDDPELTRLNITGTFTATGGSKADGTATLGEGSYIETYMMVPGDVHSGENGTDGRAVHLVLVAQSGEASIAGNLDVIHEVAQSASSASIAPLTGVAPPVISTVSFTGEVKQDVSTDLFLGAVSLRVEGVDALMDDADTSGVSDLPSTLVLEGSLYVPNRPRMLVNLQLESTAEKLYTVGGSYTQGDVAITVEGAGYEGSNEDASLVFTTENGVSMRLTPNFVSAAIKRNDVVIGRLTRSNLRVDYSDGSYEQF